MKEPFIVKEEDLPNMAKKVVDTLASSFTPKAKIILLNGDLGSGKTTFTKEIAQALGILKDEVHSPTFILKKEYKTGHNFFKKLIHIDAYRFEKKEEARVLKLNKDLEDIDTLVVIEWPEKMGHKEGDMVLNFSVLNDDTREIFIDYIRPEIRLNESV